MSSPSLSQRSFEDIIPGFADRTSRRQEPALHYNRDEHSAAKTDAYLYHQLIPYIGNKRKLLPLIAEAIKLSGVASGVFLDLLAGSGVVSRLAKTLGYKVVSNDWEPFTFEINTAYIGCNRPPAFSALGGPEKVFEHLNNLPGEEGYITTYYCPADDENPDPHRERMFFTRANGMRIDAMRERIEEWAQQGRLSTKERAFLLGPFIFATSYVSNTSGVFKAYHHGWGGNTGTALYRILSEIQLAPPVLFDNHQTNEVYHEDAQDLVKKSSADIVYVDPPYNQHQYGSNYHVLNTIALWDKPPLNKTILVEGRKKNKSAIRKDWRTKRRSPYCYKDRAIDAFTRLIENVKAKSILVSYSTDGIIPLPTLVSVLLQKGKVSVVKQLYKRYRVSRQRYSDKPYNVEYVLIVDPHAKNDKKSTQQILDEIMRDSEKY